MATAKVPDIHIVVDTLDQTVGGNCRSRSRARRLLTYEAIRTTPEPAGTCKQPRTYYETVDMSDE
jgi:hypothetical protein